MSRRLIIIVLYVFIFIGCNSNNSNDINQFFDSNKQEKTSRSVRDTLLPVRQFNLLDLNIFNDGDINVDDQYLYISDLERDKILKINRNTWAVSDSIGEGTGQGPGQANRLNDFTIYKHFLYVPDPPQRKIMVFNKDGSYIKKITTPQFRPEEVRVFNRNKIFVDATPSAGSYSFYIINSKGSIIKNLVYVQQNNNPLKYNGNIDIDRNTDTIYFSGYTEPLIKSIQLDGSVNFSMNLVNHFNSEANYMASGIGTESIRYSYSDYALFASDEIIQRQNKIFISPIHDSDRNTYNYIDLYSLNGDYKYSLDLGQNVPFTDFDISNDNKLYAIKQLKGGGGELFVYNISNK